MLLLSALSESRADFLCRKTKLYMNELKCPQCGGTRMKQMDDGYYKCQYCRVMFRPERPAPPTSPVENRTEQQPVVVNVNIPSVDASHNAGNLYCPNCGSSQLTANKKGFAVGKAAAGALLTGGVGVLAGFIGSGDVRVTCLQCGKVWKPGDLRTTPLPSSNVGDDYSETSSDVDDDDDDSVGIGCAFMAVFAVIVFILIMISR